MLSAKMMAIQAACTVAFGHANQRMREVSLAMLRSMHGGSKPNHSALGALFTAYASVLTGEEGGPSATVEEAR